MKTGHTSPHQVAQRWMLLATSTVAFSCGGSAPLPLSQSSPGLAACVTPVLEEPRTADTYFRNTTPTVKNWFAMVPQESGLLSTSARDEQGVPEACGCSDTSSDAAYDRSSGSNSQDASPLCYANNPTLSKFRTPTTIGVSTITATDVITHKSLIIQFSTSPPLCQGYENATERYFYLRQSQYAPMLDAIEANKMIHIKGVENPEDSFVRVSWGAVL